MNFSGKLTLKKIVIIIVAIAGCATVYDYFMEKNVGTYYVPIFESKGFFVFLVVEFILVAITLYKRHKKNK